MMSTWDGLKSRSQNSRGKYPRSRLVPTQEGPSPRNDAEIKSSFETFLNACKNDCGPPSCESISKLCHHVDLYHGHFSSDKVVHQTVRDILLPHLLLDEHADRNSIFPCHIHVLDSLLSLLENGSNHITGLIAPLVDDVSEEGTEKQLPNQVRRYMFQVLQHRLLFSSAVDSTPADQQSLVVVEKCCKCLISALEKATKIDGTRAHADQSIEDVDPQAIKGFLSKALSQAKLRALGLKLFLAFLKRHPDSSSAFVSVTLLEPTNDKQRTDSPLLRVCSKCGFAEKMDFLSLLHASSDSRVVALSMDVLAAQLPRLPLSLWLRPDIVRFQSSGSFRHRVAQGIFAYFRICRCRLQRIDVNMLPSFTELVKILLNRIAFESEERVQNVAVELVNDLARVFLNSEKQDVQNGVCKILVESMGGRVTPLGETTTMSSPLKLWLASRRGCEFVLQLLRKLLDPLPKISRSAQHIVCAILRSFVDVIVVQDEVWIQFRAVVTANDHSSTDSAMAVTLVEDLLNGLNGSKISRDEILSFALPILDSAIHKGDTRSLIAACHSYAFLKKRDWRILVERGLAAPIVNSLLSLCSNKDISAKVKSASCKAIGDVTFVLFLLEDFTHGEHAATLLSDILISLAEAVESLSPSVRCMTLFAFGNMMQVVRGKRIHSSLNRSALVEMSRRCFTHLQDSDEKTTSNAIRSVGHLACLFLDHPFAGFFASTSLDVCTFLGAIVEALVKRIEAAIELALHPSANKLTWKKRSAVKRHGWGACNALAIIFSSRLVSDENTSVFLRTAVDSLLRCPRYLKRMNEKVAVSAMKALRTLSPTRLPLLIGERELLADTVSSLSSYLEEKGESSSSRLDTEVSATLHHVLCCLGSNDAARVLTKEAFDALFLGQWMVREHCPVENFTAFASATQIPGLIVDFRVEHLFSAHAIGPYTPEDDNDEL